MDSFARFLPSLQKAKSTIYQIKTSQDVLIETVQQEISKFTECQALTELEKTMAKAKIYHNKLKKLRAEMTNLHERSKKLKKRSLKLQQQKQKEELTRAHNLEKEYEKEKMLTARLAPASE
ncbi:biogenesis of lysosome- organelles complex 1 subunit 6 [Bulinus truncatus]|nr:biogenesis of lysosome- organelles complex 1 subunit 6 [Bulinus truncatus]